MVRLTPRSGTVGRVMRRVKANRALLRLQRLLFQNKYIRSVYYHDTPPKYGDNLESHFRFYGENFSPVSYSDFLQFLEEGTWPKKNPGLLISFDDGLRSNFDIAYPLLEKYGFVGWFFVPTGFIGLDSPRDLRWAERHCIADHEKRDDGRIAMSWDEIRELDMNGHVVGCHTQNHRRMGESPGAEQIVREVVQAKETLEEGLGHEVSTFSWVGGEEWTYNPEVIRVVRTSGFQYCFTSLVAPILPRSNPFHLHRTGVNSRAPIDVITFQLSGLIDILYTPVRRRVTAKLGF